MKTPSYPSPVKDWFAQSHGAGMRSGLLVPVVLMPVVFLIWLLAKPGGDSAVRWFDDSMLFAAASMAAIATLVAARRYQGTRAGRSWAVIGFGMVLIAFGEGAWGFQELTLPRLPGHLDCGEILAQRGVQDGHTIPGRVPRAGGGVSAAA